MHFEYYIPAQYWTPPAKVICSSEIYIFQSFPVTRGGAGEPGMTDHDVYVCSLHIIFLTVLLCTVHIMFSSIFLQNGRELLRAVLQRKVFSRFWEQITFGLGSVERLTAIIWFAFIRRQFDLRRNIKDHGPQLLFNIGDFPFSIVMYPKDPMPTFTYTK